MDNVAVAFRAHASGIKRSPGNMRAKRMPQRRRHRRSHCCRRFAVAGMRDGSGAAETRRSSSCKTTEVTGAMLLSMFKLWTQECNPNSCNQAWARCTRRPSLREPGEVVHRNRSSSGVHVSAASSSCAHCARSVVSCGRCFCKKAMAASGAPGVNQCTRQAVFHNASPIRESVLCLRCNDRSSRRTSSKLSSSTCKRLPEPMRSADIPSPLVLSPESLAASLPFLAALRLAHPGCRTRCRHAQGPEGAERLTPGQPREWPGQLCVSCPPEMPSALGGPGQAEKTFRSEEPIGVAQRTPLHRSPWHMRVAGLSSHPAVPILYALRTVPLPVSVFPDLQPRQCGRNNIGTVGSGPPASPRP